MARVILDGVTVSFPVVNASVKSLRAQILYLGSAGALARDARGYVTVAALRGVGFRAETGDRIALVGRNGSGKTTLLKVIAGIHAPTAGSVTVEGHVSALLSGGLGVDEELTGWEAIEYGCLLRGVRPERIPALRDEIAEFTELGQYLSVPLRTYSAGMKMRLVFAVATCDAPDVLVIDEGISAGDIYFMEKARQRASRFLRQSNILFLASHSEDVLYNICNKAILLDRGEIVIAGALREVLNIYHRLEEPPRAPITVTAALRAAAEPSAAPREAGRAFASGSHPGHPAERAFDGAARTHWLSEPGRPARDAAFIGFDFGADTPAEVRQVALRQWSADLDGSSCVTTAAVQLSDDGFTQDVRTAEMIELDANIVRQSYNVSPSGKARFWRLLARTETLGGGPWGIADLDFDSVPPENWHGGRAMGSEAAMPNVPIDAPFDDNPFTHWTTKQGVEEIQGVAWIGYDFGPGRKVEVQSFTLRQWDGGERPNTIPVVKVQYSGDGFVEDVHTADTVRVAQDTERHTYPVAPSARARFWRLLADSTTDGGHWGVIQLGFSEHPVAAAPAGAPPEGAEPA